MIWEDYFFSKDLAFWENYLKNKKRDILFVIYKGFDQRMCVSIEEILKLNKTGKTDVFVIEPVNKILDHEELRNKNIQYLQTLINEKNIQSVQLNIWNEDQSRRIGSNEVSSIFKNVDSIKNYSDIIVDISAMPRGIFYSLIGSLLELFQKNNLSKKCNLFVTLVDDINLNGKIIKEGIDEVADFLPLFRGNYAVTSDDDKPKLWIPVLAENKIEELKKIYEFVTPDEICPIFPSPSLNPRRADNLLLEYREILFDTWGIDTKNIIYASESNPFEVYSQIIKAVDYYNRALFPLGGCKVALTCLSSKLLSIGTLLASYELYRIKEKTVALAHIDGASFTFTQNLFENYTFNGNLFTLWLLGEPYND